MITDVNPSILPKYPLLILVLLWFVPLGAQSSGIPATWEVSLSVAPRFQPEILLPGARREIIPEDMTNEPFQLISIGGVERRFSRGIANIYARPLEHDNWFAAQLRIHRRLSRGFDVSAGFLYAKRSFLGRPVGNFLPVGTGTQPWANYLFNFVEVDESTYGLLFNATYHLFAHNRFHPYFGMGIATAGSRRSIRSLGQIYSGEPNRIIPPTIGTTMADIASAITFDFYATGGVFYQVTNSWGIGLEINSRLSPASGLLSAQLRYGW